MFIHICKNNLYLVLIILPKSCKCKNQHPTCIMLIQRLWIKLPWLSRIFASWLFDLTTIRLGIHSTLVFPLSIPKTLILHLIEYFLLALFFIFRSAQFCLVFIIKSQVNFYYFIVHVFNFFMLYALLFHLFLCLD